MQKPSNPGIWRGRWLFLAIAGLVAVIDQLAKLWIEKNLAVGQSIFDIGFFRIIRTYNTGASFGMFQGQNLFFTIVNFIGLVLILYFVLFKTRQYKMLGLMPVRISLGLIAGGIVGNLTDRLAHGQVTDFIDFKFWPTFNVADSAITIGAIVLGLTIIILAKDGKLSSDGEKT